MARELGPQNQIDHLADVRLETLGQHKSWEQINDKPINLGVSCKMEEMEGRQAAEKEDE